MEVQAQTRKRAIVRAIVAAVGRPPQFFPAASQMRLSAGEPLRLALPRTGFLPADRRAPPARAGFSPSTAGFSPRPARIAPAPPEPFRRTPEFLGGLPEFFRHAPESLRQLPEFSRSLPESFRHAKILQKPLFLSIYGERSRPGCGSTRPRVERCQRRGVVGCTRGRVRSPFFSSLTPNSQPPTPKNYGKTRRSSQNPGRLPQMA